MKNKIFTLRMLLSISIVFMMTNCSKTASTSTSASASYFTINNDTFKNPQTTKSFMNTQSNPPGSFTAKSGNNQLFILMEPYPTSNVSLPIINGLGSGSSTVSINVTRASNGKVYFGGSKTVKLNITIASGKTTDLSFSTIWAFTQDLKDSVKISASALAEP